MAVRKFITGRLRIRGGFLLAAGLVLLLAGCGQSEITTVPPAPVATTGTVSVDTEPEDLDGSWTLTGPGDLIAYGRGDSTFTAMEPGTYRVVWNEVPDWVSPFPQSRSLTGGGTAGFKGVYIAENPFAGLEFGSDATLEVVTWNIEHFAKAGSATVGWVALAVQTLDADIVALQEIENAGYFQDLDDSLTGWTGVRATSAAYNVNLAYLYREGGDWTVDSVQEILTAYSREFPRRPYVMEGRFKGVPVVVINNHFKCCGDNYISADYWDEEARRRDAGILLDEYVRTNYPDSRVIIVGDLNDSLTDEAASNVFNVFLDAPDDWRFVDMAIAEGPSSGWSFPGWPSHLDHILINAPLFAAADGPAAEVSVVPLHTGFQNGWSGYDQYLSDHLPVAVKLIP